MGIPLALLAAGAALLIWFICEKIKACTAKAAQIRSLVSLLFIAVGLWGWYSYELILSGTFFIHGKDRSVGIALNYLSCYPAQYITALSPMFVK